MRLFLLGEDSGSSPAPYPYPPAVRRPGYALPTPTPTQRAAVWIDDGSGERPPDPFRSTLPTDQTLLGFRTGKKDPLWFRERFNGVDVPGIPFCPGNYDQTPELMQCWFTPWLLEKGGAAWLDKYIEQYMSVYGLTHARLSIPQARNLNVPERVLEDCAAAWASNGAYVCMNVFGGDGPLIDDPVEIAPLLDRMARSLTWVNNCWQHDKWFDQVDTSSGLTPLDGLNLRLWLGLYAARHGLYVSNHWMRDGAFWADAKDSPRAPCSTYTRYGISDRFNEQIALGLPDSGSELGGSYLDHFCEWLGAEHREMSGKKYHHAHLMQYDTNAPLNGIQDALISVFRATAPAGIRVVLAECEAQNQSDQKNFPPRLPWMGDAKGFAGACAVGYGQTTSGFCDGGLQPTGDWL